MAQEIQDIANTTKNNSFGFETSYDRLGRFLDAVSGKGGFGAEVAKTISGKMNPFKFQVAYVSDKQAWAIAKLAVEKGIAGPYDKKFSMYSK